MVNGDKRVKHGMLKTPEYSVWESMRTRCRNKNHKKYRLYGGRGIQVCAEWDDFLVFFRDMGPRPSLRHTLDRIDPDKGYFKENCRWASKYTQVVNSRVNSKYGMGVNLVSRPYGTYYQARIWKDGKNVSLGTFKNPDDARSAYIEAAKDKYGSDFYEAWGIDVEQ